MVIMDTLHQLYYMVNIGLKNFIKYRLSFDFDYIENTSVVHLKGDFQISFRVNGKCNLNTDVHNYIYSRLWSADIRCDKMPRSVGLVIFDDKSYLPSRDLSEEIPVIGYNRVYYTEIIHERSLIEINSINGKNQLLIVGP